MATDGSASAASEIEVGSIYPTMQEELRADAAKQADTSVAGVAWRGMWRAEEVSRDSYRGHRVELLRIADWLKNDKNRVDNSGVPGLHPAKTGTMRFRPMEGLVGCVFYLILVCICFWPQTDKVYLYLATALIQNCETKVYRGFPTSLWYMN